MNPFQVFSIQKITDMLSSKHHLSSYTKVMTVLNKQDWQSIACEHALSSYQLSSSFIFNFSYIHNHFPLPSHPGPVHKLGKA